VRELVTAFVIIFDFAEINSEERAWLSVPQFEEIGDDYKSGRGLPHSKGCRRF
jgi:hypothetical protein